MFFPPTFGGMRAYMPGAVAIISRHSTYLSVSICICIYIYTLTSLNFFCGCANLGENLRANNLHTHIHIAPRNVQTTCVELLGT